MNEIQTEKSCAVHRQEKAYRSDKLFFITGSFIADFATQEARIKIAMPSALKSISVELFAIQFHPVHQVVKREIHFRFKFRFFSFPTSSLLPSSPLSQFFSSPTPRFSSPIFLLLLIVKNGYILRSRSFFPPLQFNRFINPPAQLLIFLFIYLLL